MYNVVLCSSLRCGWQGIGETRFSQRQNKILVLVYVMGELMKVVAIVVNC